MLLGGDGLTASPLFYYLFTVLVAAFGLGYYWVARDFEANRGIVRMAIAGKVGIFAVAGIAGLNGAGSGWALAIASADLIFAGLFAASLTQGRRAEHEL